MRDAFIIFFNMRVKLVVFDLDGTLFTSDNIVHKAYESAICDFNRTQGLALSVPTQEQILNQIGNPGKTIFRTLFPSLDVGQLPALGQAIRGRLITAIRADQGRLLSGVKETLISLAENGLEMRIASNGHKDYIEAVMSNYHLSPLFGPPVYLNQGDIKDKGDILNLYKSLLGLHDDEMIMVGDRLADYQAAQKAGCPFIGITIGHGTREELLKPGAHLIDHFEDLPKTIAEVSQFSYPISQ